MCVHLVNRRARTHFSFLYYRKMMKEYLCSNFLAEQILNEVAPAHFQSRLGHAATEISMKARKFKITIFSLMCSCD